MFRKLTLTSLVALVAITGYAQDQNDTERRDKRRPRTFKRWNRNAEDMFETKKVAYFGASVKKASSKERTESKLPEGTGLKVIRITADGPAKELGIMTGDVLARMDDQMLINAQQFQVLIENHAIGDTVEVTHYRDGKEMKTTITLTEKEVMRPKNGMFNGMDTRLGGLNSLFQDVEGDLNGAIPETILKKLNGINLNDLMNGDGNATRKSIKLPGGGEATIIMQGGTQNIDIQKILKDGNIQFHFDTRAADDDDDDEKDVDKKAKKKTEKKGADDEK